MKLFKKICATFALLSTLLASTYVNTYAALPVEQLAVSKTANHIILIVGHKNNKNKVTVNDYIKSSDGTWTKNWYVGGIAGTNGISTQKSEGDKKTPEGVFNAMFAFGLKDNPGSILDYRKIGDGDYWVDDSNSSYYNKWVNISNVNKDWNSAENLKSASPFYNYALALNYNTEAIPGKGSAIFIHCTKTDNDTSSAGCIRIPEEYMKKLVQTVDSNTKIVIIENVDKLSSY
jgi:hypothetical protein